MLSIIDYEGNILILRVISIMYAW